MNELLFPLLSLVAAAILSSVRTTHHRSSSHIRGVGSAMRLTWISIAVLQVVLGAQFHDADDYVEPLAKAVMECSDLHLQLMAEEIGDESSLFLSLARTCCEDAVLALEESHSISDAASIAGRCFSRTLFPRSLRPLVKDLRDCVRLVLEEEDLDDD